MAYNLANSLTPMMFKKNKVKTEGGTRNERYRSKSMENIADPDPENSSRWMKGRGSKAQQQQQPQKVQWKELSLLKSINSDVVVTCVVPSVAMDFVASALLAVGSAALITEDPEDIEKDLEVCKAVLLDVSAPQAIVEAFIEKFELGSKPLILVASDCGTNDRKKDLAMRVIEDSGPNFITGKVVDIYTLARAHAEKTNSLVGSSDSEEETVTSQGTPTVILSMDQDSPLDMSSLPPAVRRRMKLRSASASPSTSPPLVNNKPSSATASPVTSPPDSTPSSPRNSPRSSPTFKRRGIQKLLFKKKRAQSDAAYSIKRVPTVIPRLRMKGQFRGTKGHEITQRDAFDSAQNLAARTGALIHVYEERMVTNGEVIVEVCNTNIGMNHLHSVLPVCGAVVSSVLACVDGSADDIELEQGAHGLLFYYVATEEGGISASSTNEGGLVSAGTLRTKFIDALHYLQADDVPSKANFKAHTEGVHVDL